MRNFIDTSAFMAVLNKDDQYHQQAIEYWQKLLNSDDSLFTSNYVLNETIALLQNRFGIEAVRLFENNIQPTIELLWIEKEIHRAGMVAVLATNHRKLSLVDCTSFELIRQNNFEKVFAFDSHFTEQGFNVVPSQGK